jgi:type IV secretory pathway VirB10-like protein
LLNLKNFNVMKKFMVLAAVALVSVAMISCSGEKKEKKDDSKKPNVECTNDCSTCPDATTCPNAKVETKSECPEACVENTPAVEAMPAIEAPTAEAMPAAELPAVEMPDVEIPIQ